MGDSLLKSLLSLLLLLLHTECTKIGETRCKENERKALLTFKGDLEDDYGMLSSWQEHQNEECCQWKGVHCSNKTGHVQILHLKGRNTAVTYFHSNGMRTTDGFCYLSGFISPSLTELQHLTHLDLSQNSFIGTPIPEFIGYLRKLRYLNLSYSYFTGKVPHQLGFLQHLKYLDLSKNDLKGQIPYQLGNLSHLLYLDLGNNALVGVIPHQLGNLSTLHSLTLASNDDLEIHYANPDWLSHLSSLMYLDLSGLPKLNYSIYLMQKIGQLPNLKELALAGCTLSDANFLWSSRTNPNFSSSLSIFNLAGNNLVSSTVFMWMFNFSFNLHELYLRDNILEGPIPDGFGSIISSLEYLDISGNKLKGGIPNSFGNICNLMSLDLSHNLLGGELSGLIPNSTKCIQVHQHYPLKNLNLEDNQISGTIPELSMFLSLKELSIFDNQLQGKIPESIGLLSNLEYLCLQRNSLEGEIIEPHFSKLSRLEKLDLSYNSLALKVQENWVPPFQLKELNLASCKLGPDFPKWIQTQKELDYLDISNAEISDIVPPQFWDFRSMMTHLNLSYNNLRGTIPDLSLMPTSNFEVILESNKFEGSIPPFLLRASQMRLSNNQFSDLSWFLCGNNITAQVLNLLDVSGNQLTGQLPDCWHRFKSLKILDLSNNKLSGKIPTSIGNLVELSVLILRNNSLTSELPSSLSNCTELEMLDVGENHFSGPIPSWIGESLQQLAILSMRVNDFHGSLPLQICYLAHIHLFDVSANNIIGKIPACLGNFTAMTHESSRMKFSVQGPGSYTGFPIFYQYDLYAFLMWKGAKYLFKDPQSLLNSIDLSSNQLTGGMPKEIGNLIELVSLNLSRNNLTGEITPKLGNLKSLEFLDLSRNHFVGKIPSSVAGIDRLTGIDLSNNHLSGKIPIGTQLQSFPSSSYENNSGLCGKPLSRLCSEDETREPVEAPNLEENENSDFIEALYMSMGIGFATGFWGFLGLTMLKSSWRHAYYRFLQELADKIYVVTIVNLRKCQKWLGVGE